VSQGIKTGTFDIRGFGPEASAIRLIGKHFDPGDKSTYNHKISAGKLEMDIWYRTSCKSHPGASDWGSK